MRSARADSARGLVFPTAPWYRTRPVTPAGKVNLIGLVLIAAVVAGLYWVFIFAPLYVDNFAVKEAVDAMYHQSGRWPDERLVSELVSRLNAPNVGTHKEDDGFGNVREVGGLGIKEEQVIVFRDTARNTISVQVDYWREVQLKPTSKIRTVRFVVKKEGPIPPP